MFYAVKNGHKKGLLTTKEALDKSIKDFPSPEYKEFKTMVEAMIYLSGKQSTKPSIFVQPEYINEQTTQSNKSGTTQVKTKDDFSKTKKEVFYAVRNGRKPGLYRTWDDCLDQIRGFPNNQFKKFFNKKDAENYVLNELIDIDYDNAYDDSVLNVYTDGASYHNGKEDAQASYGVYFGEDDPRNKSGLVDSMYENASNNRGELTGILRAIELISPDEEAVIHTDSMYGIKCVSEYGMEMKKKKYPKDVPNIDLIKKIRELLENKGNIRFHHLNSHTNKTDKHSIGNDMADKLATEVLKSFRN
jgi:ribonuclease HI